MPPFLAEIRDGKVRMEERDMGGPGIVQSSDGICRYIATLLLQEALEAQKSPEGQTTHQMRVII